MKFLDNVVFKGIKTISQMCKINPVIYRIENNALHFTNLSTGTKGIIKGNYKQITLGSGNRLSKIFGEKAIITTDRKGAFGEGYRTITVSSMNNGIPRSSTYTPQRFGEDVKMSLKYLSQNKI